MTTAQLSSEGHDFGDHGPLAPSGSSQWGKRDAERVASIRRWAYRATIFQAVRIPRHFHDFANHFPHMLAYEHSCIR